LILYHDRERPYLLFDSIRVPIKAGMGKLS
jgi:hypothetical protein